MLFIFIIFVIFFVQDVCCEQNTLKSELESVIPPEVIHDSFYDAIYRLSKTENLHTILEIGSSSGEGSTGAIVSGIRSNPNHPTLFCMEVSKPRFAALKKRYEKDSFVIVYNVSSVSIDAFPSEEEVSSFYSSTPTNLNQYPIERVLGWLRQDIEYLKKENDVLQNGIEFIKKEHQIKNFDMVLIDGSEFAAKAELNHVYGSRFILLDDVNAFKNHENRKKLLNDPSYILIEENLALRNGYSIFKLKDYLADYVTKYAWNLEFAIESDITPFKNGLLPDYRSWPPNPAIQPEAYVKDVKDGDIIWIQSYLLPQFYRNVMPNLDKKFILVVVDGDEDFPSSHRASFDVNKLIEDERVIHIFAQNVDERTPHKKVSPIPIGIDFHSIAHSQGWFGEVHHTVKEQEDRLQTLLSTLAPTHQRIKKAYVEFQLADRGVFNGESRTTIFNQLYPTGLLDAPSQRMSRQSIWEKKGQYAFSISPRGRGLDCHRTWEDLVLGCIVIVKTSSLDPLYEGLPVVIVKDWSEVNEANFDKWLKQYGDAFTNPDYRKRLLHAYWMNKIRSKKIKFLANKHI